MATRKSTTRSTTKKTQTNAEIQAAAELVLEREEQRKARAARRRRREQREREKEQLAAVQRMQHSIEVMKWCIVGITSVMFLGIVMAIWTLSSLHTELEKVRANVDEVRPDIENVVNEVNAVVNEVGRVRDALQNPMQSIGAAFGKELDAKLNNFLGNRLGSGE